MWTNTPINLITDYCRYTKPGIRKLYPNAAVKQISEGMFIAEALETYGIPYRTFYPHVNVWTVIL